jgi:DNA-binding IscR family transcriptional regulator
MVEMQDIEQKNGISPPVLKKVIQSEELVKSSSGSGYSFLTAKPITKKKLQN